MKKNYFLKYLVNHGCLIKREGSKHTIVINLKTKKRTSIPRHSEIDDNLCSDICKQLGIPKIKEIKNQKGLDFPLNL